MSHLFRVAFALCLITIQYVSAVDSVSVQASVPIVNECNGIPSLFHKHWHNRNTFGVIIKNGSMVKFQLENPEPLADKEFAITCLHNTQEEEVKLTFSKDTFVSEVFIKTTCVPTVGVLKLCNQPAKNLIVNLTTTETDVFQTLPTIEFKSFETYDYNKLDAEKFLDKIESYGFVSTKRAQVLIGKVDVDGLRENNLFVDGLKMINDVIEKYDEYSGRSLVSGVKGPRINANLEHGVLLLKSEEEPTPNIYDRRIKNRTFTVDFKPNCDYNKHGYQNGYNVAGGYYNSDRVVVNWENILEFFTTDARKWVLLHEIGHHYDLPYEEEPLHVDVREVWNNIYAAFYQSRFVYENEADYWIQDPSAGDGSPDEVQQIYDSRTNLQQFEYRPLAHFFMALFTLDNHDASVFRSFNIRAMNDPETSNNVLKSIAIFIKEQYNVNVAPFVDRVIYQGVPWLNLTNIYDLADSRNFRMPCFYYTNSNTSMSKTLGFDYKYKYTEHYLKPTTNLHLCSTTMDEPNKIVITVDNPELANQRIKINSILEEVRNSTIEINSRDTEFVVWGELNKTAVIQPTYTFCNPKTDYKCAVSPKLLIYDNRNPSQLLPPFRFDILGLGDILSAILQIDIGQKKFMIKTLVEDPHSYFPKDEGVYVTIELYNSLNSSVASYLINGTNMPIEEVFFDIDLNFTFELKAEEKHRVKIFNYTLNDFQSNSFKIYEFGLAEAAPVEPNIIMRRFADILNNDLEYKPYLKSYQHLTDLLRILQTE